MKEPILFSLAADHSFAEQVAKYLGLALGRHEERDFEDGEHKIRPLESVRGRDLYLIQSLYGDASYSVNDKLIRLTFFIGALKDAGAARITLVCPYLCYARKDRQTKPRDPLSLRYLAQMLESAGLSQVVTLEVHNPAAFQNAFRIPTIHLTAVGLMLDDLIPRLGTDQVTVASPDVGGMKRAEMFRETLERRLGITVPAALMEKHRSSDRISGDLVAGELQGRLVLMVDDLIASGRTLIRAARAFLERGAREVRAIATHGVFAAEAGAVLSTPDLTEILITDSLPPTRLTPGPSRDKLRILSIAPLLAQTIACLHKDASIQELIDDSSGSSLYMSGRPAGGPALRP